MTPEQRRNLYVFFMTRIKVSPDAGSTATSMVDHIAELLTQARADALEEAAKVCAEPERREDYMGGKTWVECAAAIRARKDA